MRTVQCLEIGFESRAYLRFHLVASRFVRGQGRNAQGVDIGPHQVVQRTIHDLVTLQRAQAGEGAGNQMHAEMSAAVARPGMKYDFTYYPESYFMSGAVPQSNSLADNPDPEASK